MKAITDKNYHLHATVTKATLYLEGIEFITFIILFALIVNFPGFILNPLNKVMEGISEIRQKNFDVRLDFKTSDEFAELANEFNNLAISLGELENSNLTQLFSKEAQINTLIEEIPHAVIGTTEKQEILFINSTAKKLLNLNEGRLVGKLAQTLKNNEIIELILKNKDINTPLKISSNGKTSYFQQDNFEISVPNFKPDILNTLQIAEYSVGTIYILKNVTEPKEFDELNV